MESKYKISKNVLSWFHSIPLHHIIAWMLVRKHIDSVILRYRIEDKVYKSGREKTARVDESEQIGRGTHKGYRHNKIVSFTTRKSQKGKGKYAEEVVHEVKSSRGKSTNEERKREKNT